MNQGITYTQVSDYLLPDITIKDSPTLSHPLGRYGRMRRAFLKQNRPILYSELLLSERLFPHLCEIDEAAESCLLLAEKENMLAAEEVILTELVYD